MELRAQIQAQLRLAHTLKRLAEHAGQLSTSHNTQHSFSNNSSFTESHNLDIELDLAGDLALLRKNLAKMRKGKMGKGLHDVLIEEFEWVRKICTGSFSKDVFSQGAVNWVFLGLFHYFLY